MRKRTQGLLAIALAAVVFAGCGDAGLKETSSDTAYAVSGDYAESNGSGWDAGLGSTYDYETDAVAEEESGGDAAETSAADGEQTGNLDSITLLEEKLVYHCSMDIETTEYQNTLKAVRAAIDKYDGIIQAENETDSSYDWYYEDYRKTYGTLSNYLQVRIPSANYKNFISELDGVGKVVAKRTSVENITQAYYDTTVEVEALKQQEENLLSMLKSCETIEDMIAVQDRLTEVQTQLNKLKTELRYMDVDVAYSYVNIQISEVMEYRVEQTENTFINRLKETFVDTGKGFLDFLEEMLFLIIHLIPYAMLVAVVVILLRRPVRRWKEKRARKKEESK